MLQAVLRLLFLALIVHTAARLLRRGPRAQPGGISQGTPSDRVKTPGAGRYTPDDIVDGDFEEIPSAPDSGRAC